jgi:glycosyltransferase involved in cell wall biosynthesis
MYIVTKSNWGGAQRNVFDLATDMKKRGHEVIVVLGGSGVLQKKLEDAGVFTHSVPSMARDISLKDDWSSFREIISVIKHRKPDVLHLHSTKASGLGALAGRIQGVKKIYFTVHGWAFNEDRSFFSKMFIVIFSWITCLLCHKIIHVSKSDRDISKRFPFCENKLETIYLGINSPMFMSIDGAKQILGKSIGLDASTIGKKMIIGTIAELHKNKGLGYMLDAMSLISKNHNDVLYIVVGEGEKRKDLEEQIANLGLKEKVFLVGFIENAVEIMKAFSVFVLPSIKEGLPYTVLEAGIASLPVVATTVGGIPEIIEDMKSGVLVQPKKVSELSHAVSFMIEQANERKRYGTILRERILNDFSLNKMLDATESLYKR